MSDGPRVLLVTGASSGIGRATALAAAARGDHLVLVARGEGPLAAVGEACAAAGAGSVQVRPTDVADDADVASCVAEVLARHGRIDAVVNSAGVVAYGRTEEVPVEVFDQVVRTNLLGSVNLARHVLPGMRERGSGSFVQIGSVIGHLAVPTMTAYAVSKWGVRALARQLQVENRDRPGVHVSYVAPGGVDTPIYLQAANYHGVVGRPPPPVVTPERVAAVVLHRLDHPRHRTQVGPANGLMRLGFSALPGVYDALVGPLFPVGATDLTHPVDPGAGNVLESRPADNRLRGQQGGVVRGVLRNLRTLLRPPALRAGELTYAPVGLALDGALPAGFRHLERSAVVGTGRATLDRAGEALLRWQVHRDAGLRVRPEQERVVVGSTVRQSLGVGPLRVQAPCRVVGLVEDERRRGFSYGSLPGHAETGEEAFVLELHDDDRVTFTVRAYANPATVPARLGGPVSRRVQGYVVGRYLAAAARLARG